MNLCNFVQRRIIIKVKVFPVHAMKECRGSKGIAPLILNLSNSCI